VLIGRKKKKEKETKKKGEERQPCNLDSCTNRLGVPSNAEVELAASAVSGWRRECDDRHVEHMRERVMMMMMMMMVMQLMTIVSILPTHAEMRFGYVKA